ncbi:MAG: hypothetical protein QOH86_267 [Sphingomonadales bacterium]|nr:hypothetical protein [Sphingomonadales bacterium]
MAAQTVKELLAKALKRQEELKFETKALEDLIEAYKKLEEIRQEEGREVGQLTLWEARSRRALQSAQVASMLDVARKIILAEEKPMRRGELVARLETRGFTIDGADKHRVFGTNVWRSKKFIHVPGKGYWPADVPLPNVKRSG